MKNYVKNNLYFLRKCSRESSNSTTLVKFEVKSLYASIPHSHDLEAISFRIEKRPDSLHFRFSKELILGCIKLRLENDNCTFNDEF